MADMQMTRKQSEELEQRQAYDALRQAQDKANTEAARINKNRHIDLTCDFYNLQLEPCINGDVPYPQLMGDIQGVKKRLKPRDARRVKTFLRKITREDMVEFAKEQVEVVKWHVEQGALEKKHLKWDNDELVYYQQRDLSEWLPDEEWKAWYKSRDFRTFIAHYVMLQKTINDLLSSKFHIDSQHWLQDLMNELYPPSESILQTHEPETIKAVMELPSETGKRRFKDISSTWIKQKGIDPLPDGYYDLNTTVFRWRNRISAPLDWCGLSIRFLGEALLEGIYQILVGGTQVRRCELEGCEKIARFPTQGRGGRNKIYCSRNCTQKASDQRSENRAKKNIAV